MLELSNISGGSTPTSITDALGQSDMGKDEFLRLLIEQMKNQNPLDPMNNQEFASQLAQFTSLEKLSSIDGNLAQGVEIDLLLTRAINNSMAATFVGKSVKAVGDTLLFDGERETELAFRLDSDAERGEINIKDENGTTIRTMNLDQTDSGEQSVTWDGKDNDGNVVEAGTYSFEVNAYDSKDNTISVDTFVSGLITGVRYENGNTVLVVNDEEIPFSKVIEISATSST